MNLRKLGMGILFFWAAWTAVGTAQHLSPVRASEPVFRVPESVYYDAGSGRVFISNINGKPAEKNGQGFISQMTPNGKIIKLKWVTGLDAPKGIDVFKGRLFVSDIDRLRVVSISKGEIVKTVVAANARFLNDVAVDERGMVYVSDMSGSNSAIYRYDGKTMTPWLTGAEIKSPNGLFYHDGILYVGNSGDGAIKAVDVRSKKIRVVANVGHGIDGLIRLQNGDFIISDWSGKIEYVTKEGKVTVLLNTTDKKINAADLGFVPEQSLVLVPTFFDNRVTAYRLKK